MPIVPSPASRIHALVEQLSSPEPAQRDRAVARLTLLGARAVEPVAASIASAPPAGRLAALEVLEAVDDPRALAAIVTLVSDRSDSVASRAADRLAAIPGRASVAALAEALTRGRAAVRRASVSALARLHGKGVVEALTPLVDLVVDEAADTRLRLEVLDQLGRLDPPLPRGTLRPLARRLAGSPVTALADRAADLAGVTRRDAEPGAELLDRLAAAGTSPADRRRAAAAVRRMRPVPVARLRRIVDTTREPAVVAAIAELLGETADPASIPILARALGRLSGDESGLRARVAIHAALAALDSRIALHDLRELVAAPPRPLPEALLAAVERIGDDSLVPALARAVAEDPALVAPWGRAYAAIARRHRLRRTSAALRKVRKEHRAALEALLARSRRRP